jgi:hypothetical protein
VAIDGAERDGGALTGDAGAAGRCGANACVRGAGAAWPLPFAAGAARLMPSKDSIRPK